MSTDFVRAWRNNITNQTLFETGERRGAMVGMVSEGGSETEIHEQLLGNGEWRTVPLEFIQEFPERNRS